MFKQSDADNQMAQLDMASLVLSPEFQEGFNLRKGSIPARTDLDMGAFDSCAHRSMADFKATSATTGLVPSMAHGMSTSSSVQGAIYDVTAYFNDSDMSAKDAVEKLSKAVKAAIIMQERETSLFPCVSFLSSEGIMRKANAKTSTLANALETWLPKVVLSPTLVITLVFIYGFMVWSFVLSLTGSRLIPVYDFVGFDQYIKLFENERWMTSLTNLAIFGVLFVLLCLSLGPLMAILLDQKIRAEGFIRTIPLPDGVVFYCHRYGVEVDYEPNPRIREVDAQLGVESLSLIGC